MKLFGAAVLSVAMIGLGAAPASATLTTDFAYSCESDTFTFTAHDPFASGQDPQGIALAFANGGAVDFKLLSDVASPDPVVISGNTDDIGVRNVPVSLGDRIDVYFTKYDRNAGIEPTDAQLLGGTKVGSFGFCGSSTQNKLRILNTENSVAYSYRNWDGRASYDCWSNSLFVSKAHESPIPLADAMQPVLIHNARAVKTDLYQTFLPANRWVGDLVPGLRTGDRIDVYAVPGEWLNVPIGAFPRNAFANKVINDPSAQAIYSFRYGMCGAISLPIRPVIPVVPVTPAPVTAPVSVPKSKKVTWAKRKGKAVTYKVRISKAGNTRAFGNWRSTGRTRSATFTALLPGTYRIQIQSKPKSKPAKLFKTLTVTIT